MDTDSHLSFIRKIFSTDFLLTYILGLRKGEVLERVLKDRLPKIIPQLEKLIKRTKEETYGRKPVL